MPINKINPSLSQNHRENGGFTLSEKKNLTYYMIIKKSSKQSNEIRKELHELKRSVPGSLQKSMKN